MKTTRLGKGVLYAFLELELRDENGKIVSKQRKRCQSFVANFLRFLNRQWRGTGVTPGHTYITYAAHATSECKDASGTVRSVYVGSSGGSQVDRGLPWLVDAQVGITTHGIRVGTGDTPVDPDQYRLVSAIEHGTDTGQLNHGATTVENVQVSGNECTLRVIRTFTNSSGDAITVKEIGLFCLSTYTHLSPYTASFMLARDVVTPMQIPVGNTLTVRYILRTVA